MSGSHNHGPMQAMGWVVGINLAFVIAEGIGGWLAQSTALWADAIHNLSDVAGLALAWGATRLARMPRTPHRTFGLRKTTLLAALANAVLIIVAVVGVVVEAVGRFGETVSPSGPLTIGFALVGVALNGGSAAVFAKRRKHDLNARGIFLHLMADAAVSLAVVISGVLITLTGTSEIDPVTSLLVSVAILYATWGLLRESLDLVLDAVPHGIDVPSVQRFLVSQPGVQAAHDLHIWAMSSTEVALTAHLVMSLSEYPAALGKALESELKERFGVAHVTIQIDYVDAGSGVPDCEGGCDSPAASKVESSSAAHSDHHDHTGH